MTVAQRDDYMSLYRNYIANKTEGKVKKAQLEEVLKRLEVLE
jgi:hypothetical protein